MASQTTVVLINWNGEEFLPALLESFLSNSPAEIIVVDNASADSSREILATFPKVRSVLNGTNLGFGAAANQGITIASTPFVFVGNVDIEAKRGSLDLLERYLETNPSVAVVAPQLLFPDGRIQPSCRAFPSALRLFLYLSFLDRIFPSGYRWSTSEHQHAGEVDQPMGAALLFRRSVLQDVGAFDPRFFLYMEEVDLCERIKLAGWKIVYFPEAKMMHYAGGSSSKAWEKSQTYFFESTIRYFQKRSGPAGVLLLRLSLLFALLIRSGILFFMGRFRQSWFYLKTSPYILWLS